jgi:hypothetical protein
MVKSENGKWEEWEKGPHERQGARVPHREFCAVLGEKHGLAEHVGKTRVARLMRENALQGRQRKRYVPRTTQGDHDAPITAHYNPRHRHSSIGCLSPVDFEKLTS